MSTRRDMMPFEAAAEVPVVPTVLTDLSTSAPAA
jgi:hypothetical protein